MVEMDDRARTVMMAHIWLSAREQEIMERAEMKASLPDVEDRHCPVCGHLICPYTGRCRCDDE